MKKIQVCYKECGKFTTLIIYGMDNFMTWLDENKSYVDIIDITTL